VKSLPDPDMKLMTEINKRKCIIIIIIIIIINICSSNSCSLLVGLSDTYVRQSEGVTLSYGKTAWIA